MATKQEIQDTEELLKKQSLPPPHVVDSNTPIIPSEEDAPEPSSLAPSNATNPSDILKALTLHNSLRRSRNIPPLIYDKFLEDSARQWAENLAKNIGKLQHAADTSQRENIYWVSGGGIEKEPCVNATRSWLNEGRWYRGQKVGGRAEGATGHYTQCMWPRTRRVGIAAVEGVSGDGKRGVYVVARYEPGGNSVGERSC
ncbi:Putative pathogenesis-related protein [Podospora comata]|uniref:Pathogenesis-related protein n=1 Tax=Podospora comata TaxID=48703 RepID=A0ABY6SBX7_PODCO|nr:Putative pathogenesis-related protein [Podospora comata]